MVWNWRDAEGQPVRVVVARVAIPLWKRCIMAASDDDAKPSASGQEAAAGGPVEMESEGCCGGCTLPKAKPKQNAPEGPVSKKPKCESAESARHGHPYLNSFIS